MCDRERSTHVRPQAVDSSKRDLQSSLDEDAGRFPGPRTAFPDSFRVADNTLRIADRLRYRN